MTNEPARPQGLPDTSGIGPNEPVVSFEMHECRTCGDRSEWHAGDDDRGWSVEHAKDPEHRRFYAWTITRQTSTVYFMPTEGND